MVDELTFCVSFDEFILHLNKPVIFELVTVNFWITCLSNKLLSFDMVLVIDLSQLVYSERWLINEGLICVEQVNSLI